MEEVGPGTTPIATRVGARARSVDAFGAAFTRRVLVCAFDLLAGFGRAVCCTGLAGVLTTLRGVETTVAGGGVTTRTAGGGGGGCGVELVTARPAPGAGSGRSPEPPRDGAFSGPIASALVVQTPHAATVKTTTIRRHALRLTDLSLSPRG